MTAGLAATTIDEYKARTPVSRALFDQLCGQLQGVYAAPRGMLNLSTALEDDHLAAVGGRQVTP
ncbi:MAG: hypothetical protein ACLP1E_05465 [Acidimicrobiales bacterium]